MNIMSGYIKSIHIEGFKKFKNFDMEFNSKMNILVGENEAGKSTILDAIRLVLNQDYRNADRSVLEDLFNASMIKKFRENPSLENMPRIYIEVILDIDTQSENSQFYSGEHNRKEEIESGISFTCEFDKELWENELDWRQITEVPYEFYKLKWMTFSGQTYNPYKRAIHFLSLDTSQQDKFHSFNYYNKTVFSNAFDATQKLHIKNKFRSKMANALSDESMKLGGGNHRELGIDSKKVILENIISILQDGVSLENHGSGMESLIKTEIALEKSTKMDVIMLEEPENHLSFPNLLKMIDMIVNKREDAQIIVATHSSMIASRLSLSNVSWITEDKAVRLENIHKDDADFFYKLANNNLLQLLLAKKVILVEGVTEYLLVPAFYEKITGVSVNQSECIIIPCNGVSYMRYINIAKSAGKKVAVLTDNDQKKAKVEECQNFNNKNPQQRIFTDPDTNNWTWEVCLYNQNRTECKKLISDLNSKSRLNFAEESPDSIFIEYMTDKRHKAEIAFQILRRKLIEDNKLKAPGYVKEAIEWLEK